MKQVSTELLNYLHTRKEFYMCDLYELQLLSGLTFRYANYDMPISLPDGRYFTHQGPAFKRDRTKLSSKITVDKVNVTMYVGQSDTIGGTPTLQVAHNGGFDGATLSLLRCFMDAPGSVVGAVDLFSGDIDITDGGGLELTLEVKSGVQRLNVEWPLRKYYPTCPYSLYSAGCGLSLEAYKSYGKITEITAGLVAFTTNLTFSESYFDGGGIEFTTGPLTGAAAPIKYSAGGKITLLIPLESAPAAGNEFVIYPGCDKTPATCRSKFNNFSKNRATPYIPLKETIM